MRDFYDILSQCRFVISLTDRNTPGRLQGEAAFFNIPVVGSDRLELQNELFPSLSMKPYDLEVAVEKSQWVLDNPEKADAIAATARQKLINNYNYKKSFARLQTLLKRTEGE